MRSKSNNYVDEAFNPRQPQHFRQKGFLLPIHADNAITLIIKSLFEHFIGYLLLVSCN